jgi:hypothetical protein
VLDPGNQLRGERTQLFGAEGVAIGGQVHADEFARTSDTVKARLFKTWLASKDADDAVCADALPTKPTTRSASCSCVSA